MRPLPSHHAAWLASHPHRTEEWFRARIADGFDIHHLDRDRSNNSPGNLAMIECTDHMRLHGTPSNRLLSIRRRRSEEATAKAKDDYELLSRTKSWFSVNSSYETLRKYAKHAGLPWPVISKGSK
jgi:hypothetical protein